MTRPALQALRNRYTVRLIKRHFPAAFALLVERPAPANDCGFDPWAAA
jgi:hypothetical protein